MNWLDLMSALIIVWVFLVIVLLTDWLMTMYLFNKKG